MLTPVPVFRWSLGQSLDQNLQDLPLPLFERLMEMFPSQRNTLVASGDVLVQYNKLPAEIPPADVICLEIWVETPPSYIQTGGCVLNMAVNLNGQPPLQVFVLLSKKPHIVLRSLDSGVLEIISSCEDLTLGHNLLGTCGGGYLLMCAKDEGAVTRIKENLSGNPPNGKARFVNMELNNQGLEISRS